MRFLCGIDFENFPVPSVVAMFCLSSLKKAKIFDLQDFKINEFCNLWLRVGLKESYQNLGEQALLCCFWPGIRSRKCPRSQEASFHKSSLILANSGGLETTAGSYMTLITWKLEGGKKSGSRVFEGFLIADKQPKFYRINAAHICPSQSETLSLRLCVRYLLGPLLRASVTSGMQGDGVSPRLCVGCHWLASLSVLFLWGLARPVSLLW